MINGLIVIVMGILYSWGGAGPSWLRSYVIAPVTAAYIGIVTRNPWAIVFGLGLAIAYSMSYGYNSPVRKWVRETTGKAGLAKIVGRVSYGLFIFLSALPVLLGLWTWAIVHLLLQLVGAWVGVVNPFSKLKLGTLDPARIEEFVVGLLSVAVPLLCL